ncbi:hypothetical protein [Microbulbifer sp. JMSA008]|uniref:hypothetical protein n=1 Tax=Microbulbifer sp. JMSA008 TaxID=3243373 RepID=UPI0040392622
MGEMKYLLVLALSLVSSVSAADWHQGELEYVGVGYDGETITFSQVGVSRNNCTCYPAWPTRNCLDRSRDTFEQEYAFLLSAKARGISVSVNVDETTCKVIGMYEK